MTREKLLSAQGLTKEFGDGKRADRITVLREISMDVSAGEMVAIVGPSGSGKSTLLFCLSGFEKVTSGAVTLLGTELGRISAGRLASLRQKRVGFIFQAYNLIASLSAWENVALPLRLRKGRFDSRVVDAALAAVGISERASHLPGELSGGQQQRVAIARILATSPQLIFADEPTGALDTQTSAVVLSLLRQLATGTRSVVLVTHDLEAAALADRVLVLRDGEIHAELAHPTPELVLAAIERAKLPVPLNNQIPEG
ncbi:ABC transporter ATP-binding protein [Marisediminicola sp. LYQ85]|uniref:ABC transporter ATP-binding protein n=1 Tax=Marisediminicola sp. LYQ85 TaxID=3391062 RepID=UPI0039831711